MLNCTPAPHTLSASKRANEHTQQGIAVREPNEHESSAKCIRTLHSVCNFVPCHSELLTHGKYLHITHSHQHHRYTEAFTHSKKDTKTEWRLCIQLDCIQIDRQKCCVADANLFVKQITEILRNLKRDIEKNCLWCDVALMLRTWIICKRKNKTTDSNVLAQRDTNSHRLYPQALNG